MVDQKQLKDILAIGRNENSTNRKTITIPPTVPYGDVQINCGSQLEGWHGINFSEPWNSKSKNWMLMCNYWHPTTPTTYHDFFGWFNYDLAVWSFYVHDGNMFAKSYGYLSDKSKKRDIAEIPSVLDKVKKIKPISFKWTADISDSNETRLGFSAQQLQEQFPEVVKESTDPFNSGLLIMDSGQALAVLWKAFLELTEKVEALERRNLNRLL